MKRHEKKFYVKTRIFESNYGLWTAFLAVDGILVAAFSIVSLRSPNSPVHVVLTVVFFILCFISALYIVQNFQTARTTHQGKLKALDKKDHPDKYDDEEPDTTDADDFVKITEEREKRARWSLFMAFLIIIFFYFSSHLNFPLRNNDNPPNKSKIGHDNKPTEPIKDITKDSTN